MSAVGSVQSSVENPAAPTAGKTIVLLSSSSVSLALFRGEFMRKLAGRGMRVIALAPDFDPAGRERIRDLGAEPMDITLERTGLSPLHDLRDLVRLARLFRHLSPDAVIGYFIKPVIYGTLAAKLARVPRRFALIAGLGYVFTESGLRDSWKRKALRLAVSSLYKLALSLCDRVFFLNRDDRDAFLSTGRVGEDKVVLLPSEGIDLDRFSPAPPVTSPIRFLLIARLLREKGLVEFAEAARIVRARHPDVEFHLVGGVDPNPGALRPDLVESWAREGILEWKGEMADVRPAIAMSSVYVLPSYREGKPISTQEAMAMARPIITTDVPGCRDTVEEGVNGFLVPVRDSRALAEAMMRFVDEPGLIPVMGTQSRRIAERDFNVAAINEAIVAAIGLDHWAPLAPPSTSPVAGAAPQRVVILGSYASSLINFRGPLIAELAARRHKVFALAADMDEEIAGGVQALGAEPLSIRLGRTSLNPFGALATLRDLSRTFRSIAPHTVFAYTIKPIVLGAVAARAARVPRFVCLVTGLGYAFTGGREPKRLFSRAVGKILYRRAFARASLAVFQNPDDLGEFRRLKLLPPSLPTTLINGSGVDIAHFSPAPLPAGASFLLIARLLKDKGIVEFARAAARLKAERPEVRISMVGFLDTSPNGIGKAELDAMVAAGVEYLGPQADVRPAIGAHSVYVLPSYREGTPRSVLEAMAMGRPVITTDAPGCRETVVDGVNGLLVPVRDWEALYRAMLRFVDEPSLIAPMGAASRRIAEDKFNVRKVNAALLAAADL